MASAQPVRIKVSRVLPGLLLLVAVLAAGLTAGEVWKKKPPSKWSEKEAIEILTDSPWAKQVPLIGPLRWDYNPETAIGPGDLQKVHVPAQVKGRSEKSPRGGSGGRLNFLVQWASAMTFRQAIAQVQQLRGNITAEQAAQWLAQPAPSYELMISGAGVTAFADHDEAWYQENCRLNLKPGKVTLTPAGVQLIRSGENEQVTNITLLFLRRDETQQEMIPSGTEKVELGCKADRNEMSATFDLRKMAVEGEPDL